MIFTETKLNGAYIIEPEKLEDERGVFARTFCQNEFKAHGLNPCVAQCSISFNERKGTLRGVHYQARPYEETKLVRCTAGAIYDVIVDVRLGSRTFKQWLATELSAANRKMLYIPHGVAHGFLTLVDETEVFYQMSEFYHPECARGLRWNDPALVIEWPSEVCVISGRDSRYPEFCDAVF